MTIQHRIFVWHAQQHRRSHHSHRTCKEPFNAD
jgi:hypothetical protein